MHAGVNDGGAGARGVLRVGKSEAYTKSSLAEGNVHKRWVVPSGNGGYVPKRWAQEERGAMGWKRGRGGVGVSDRGVGS